MFCKMTHIRIVACTSARYRSDPKEGSKMAVDCEALHSYKSPLAVAVGYEALLL
jgi:hypothetical protein